MFALRNLLALMLCSVVAVAPLRAQDEVELTDGTKLEGRVVFEDEQEVVVLLTASRERTLPRGQVKSVRSRTRSLHEVLDQWDRLKPADAAGLWQLASVCRDRGLSGEAEVFAWMVVRAEPEHAAAHELLGHKQRGGVWQVQADKAWLPLDRLHKLRAVFQDGWEFTTLHYRLRTNLPLETALATLIDLERFHRFFYKVLGGELKLREVQEPMYAAVYADAKSYPATSDGRSGYYSPGRNTLFVLADRGLDAQIVYHEATHQLLTCTAERDLKSRGSVPAWLSEGVAVYMESSGQGVGGHATFELGKPAPMMFAEHARAKKPFDLPRVFSLGADDFAIRSRAALKYAQSYTLVHFCLHSEGGRLRPGFMQYLRMVYHGNSSNMDFREAIGLRQQELENAWHAYARSLAPH